MPPTATVTPAPPSDLPGLVAAYEQTVRSVLALGRSCPPERAADPTPCPGWDVFAQVAHVESVEATLAGEAPASTDVGERPHVRSDMGRFMEQLIEARRDLSLPELCDRLGDVIDRRRRRLGDPRLTAETVVPGPFGDAPVADVLGVRIFDIWTHEQDLRESLDRPGGLDSPAASVAVARMYAGLGRVVARAEVPVGRTVVVDVRGPVSARAALQVVEVDGRRRGVPVDMPAGGMPGSASEGSTGDTTSDTTGEEAFCVLSLGTRELGRLAAGRTAVHGRGFPWQASGDRAAAASIVAGLAMTP